MDKKIYLSIRKELLSRGKAAMFLKHIAVDGLILSAMFSICFFGQESRWVFLAAFGVPVLMFRSFALMHDAVHGAVFKSSWDQFVGTLYGAFALLAFEQWKQAHIEHHYWSGNSEKDPVMALLIVYPKFPKWLKSTLSFGWKNWLPIMAVMQHIVFWSISIKKLRQSPKSFKVLASTLWPILFWACTVAWLPGLYLKLVLVPGILLYLAFVEFVNLPHHLRLPMRSGDSRLPFWQQHETARSCIYPKWMERLVTLNFNYHAEHHMYPDLPWYQLHRVHALVKPELGSQLNMDVQFAWTIHNRKKDLGYVLANHVPEETHIVSEELASIGTR